MNPSDTIELLITELKKEISNLKESQCFSFTIINDALKNLNEIQMTSELLKKTLVGKTLTKLQMRLDEVKDSEDAVKSSEICKEILSKWKSTYTTALSSHSQSTPSSTASKSIGISNPLGGGSAIGPKAASTSSSSSTSSTSSFASNLLKPVKSNIDTITITYGDMAENHVGMQKIGVQAEKGYSLDDIMKAKSYFESVGGQCQLMDLRDAIKDPDTHARLDPAYVLIIRNGVDCLLKDIGKSHVDMYREQSGLNYDTKVFMYGQVRNKHARYNLCFSEVDQEPDYINKKGRIVGFDKVPLTNYIRNKIPSIFDDLSCTSSGSTASNNELQAEGNYYYDASKCGIGFHGDAERLKVVAVRLGRSTIPMHWQWYIRNQPVGDRIKVTDLSSGAMYIMSEKATGFDWKRSSLFTLRHAAGAAKFLK